jgi:hypothetical protein
MKPIRLSEGRHDFERYVLLLKMWHGDGLWHRTTMRDARTAFGFALACEYRLRHADLARL